MALDKCCNTPSTFIHSCSLWPAYFFHWLCSTSAAAFLPPTHQPKLSSLAYLQPVLSPSLPVSDSCLHTASYTRHCFSSQHHPAFPGSPLRCGRRAQGRDSSHVLCEDAWQRLCPCHACQYCLISISSPDTADCKRDLVFDVARPYKVTSVLHQCSVFWLEDVPSPQGPMMFVSIALLTKNPEKGQPIEFRPDFF